MSDPTHDDETLATAYVFGELDGPARAGFERRLLTDTALRDQVDAVRDTVGTLSDAFAAAPAPRLLPEQRARIVAGGAARTPSPHGALHRLRLPVFAASAAAAFLAVQALGVPFAGGVRSVPDRTVETASRVTESSSRIELDRADDVFAEETSWDSEVHGEPRGGVPGTHPSDELETGEEPPQTRERREADVGVRFIEEHDANVPDPRDVAAPSSASRPESETTRLRFLAWSAAMQTALADDESVRPHLEVGLAEAANTVRLRYDVAERLALLSGSTLPDGGNLATLFPQNFIGFSVQSQGGVALDLAAPKDVAAATALSTVLLDGVDLPQVQRLLETLEVTRRTVEQARPLEPPSGERYAGVPENPFLAPSANPLSTFGVDVDTASFANVRRMVLAGQRPPAAAVRVEEFVNAFDYSDAAPTDGNPIAANVEVAACPWTPENRLVRVGLKAREVQQSERPPSNLVFLIDTSGSMADADKLPLLQQSMKLLVRGLGEDDHVGIVTYSDSARATLEPVSCASPETVTAAIDGLHAQGSTNGADGLRLAYRMAAQHFRPKGINRVLLATDGDFNVGVSETEALTALITEQATSNVFLTVLGFGTGNLKDDTLERLADRGNGHYAYLDSLEEAHRVLVDQAGATLQTVAKDVKVQVEFNPLVASSYRLIGYENRAMAAADFTDDTKDGGEVGAGHAVTALYEVVPNPSRPHGAKLDYQSPDDHATDLAKQGYLLTLHVRAKQPEASESTALTWRVKDDGLALAQASPDFKFSSAVASYAMLLRQSQFRGSATFDSVIDLASQGLGDDPKGRRVAFLDLVRKTKALLGQ